MGGTGTQQRWRRWVVATSTVIALALVGEAALGTAGSATTRPSGATEPDPSTPTSTEPPSTLPTEPPSTPAPTDPPSTPAPTDPPSTPAPFSCVGVRTTPELPEGDPRRIAVSDRSVNRIVAVGTAKGPATKDLQRRLLELGFWLSSSDGVYGTTTKQAVMAYQKYVGLPPTSAVDQATADSLSCARFRAYSSVSQNWTLIEVDKSQQLLFIVQNGVTRSVLNTSTGSGRAYRERSKTNPKVWKTGVSITPSGWHKIYWQWPNGWKPGELGRIYRPKYIYGGVAIHGSSSIPAYPASHGCIRLSTAAMDMVWSLGWVQKGTSVWVHE
jgi:lipoprotein-anchoring transpeptidase ErfK/SrfK